MHHFKNGFLVLRQLSVITPLTDDDRLTFTKCWIYPASAAAAGLLTANANNIFIGKRGAGEPITPDILFPTDNDNRITYKIEILAGQEPMKLNDVIIQGSIGDGVFFSFT